MTYIETQSSSLCGLVLFGLLLVWSVSIELVAGNNIRLEVFPEESIQCLQMQVSIGVFS